MRKILLSTVVMAGLIGPAFADDPIASKSPPGFAASTYAFGWNGFYAGVNAGTAFGPSSISTTLGGAWIGDPDNAGVTAAGRRTLNPTGFTGGGLIGYNYQINNFVLGLEADANYLGLKKSYATGILPGVLTGTFSATGTSSTDWLITLRPRLGVAVDHGLFFVTGGLAIADHGFSQTISYVNAFQPVLPVTSPAGGANAGSVSTTNVGWTLGGGTEYTFAKQWSLKAEYLYVDLGTDTFSSTYTSLTPLVYTAQHRDHLTTSIIHVGLNYRFGEDAAVFDRH